METFFPYDNITTGNGQVSGYHHVITNATYLDTPIDVRVKCKGRTGPNSWNYLYGVTINS